MKKPTTDKAWKEIPVGKDRVAKIDAEDYERVTKHRWRARTAGSGRQLVVTTLSANGTDRQVTLGWFLMQPPEGKQVYPRRFQNGFDYRKENLIVCTMKERQQILPKGRRVQTSSRYKGVSRLEAKNRWKAAIQVEGKTIHIGLFKTEEEAASAYNDTARKYFGEMAYQNQVQASVPDRRTVERENKARKEAKKAPRRRLA